jgi:hypothetical protein
MYIVQSVLLRKSKYTKHEAIEWIKKHNYHHHKIDETREFFRFRQRNPDSFPGGRFRTIPLGSDGEMIMWYS